MRPPRCSRSAASPSASAARWRWTRWTSTSRPGRGHGAAGRERGRQVDADQDPGRGARARRGRDPAARPAGEPRPRLAADQLRPPGPRPRRRHDGGRERGAGRPATRVGSASSPGAACCAGQPMRWRRSAAASTRRPRSASCRRPSARWWRSRGRSRSRPTSSCSTSRPPHCRSTTSPASWSALRRLRERGLAILYVTHRLDEVFRVADRVTVLRDGRRVLSAPVAETTPAALVRSIIGRSLDEVFQAAPRARGETVLAVNDLVTRRCWAGELDAPRRRGPGPGRPARRRPPRARPRHLRGGTAARRADGAGGQAVPSGAPGRRGGARLRLRLQPARGGEPAAEPLGAREPAAEPGRAAGRAPAAR